MTTTAMEEAPATAAGLPGVAAAVAGDVAVESILVRAQAYGKAANLPYAGALGPADAWALHTAGAAQLVDIRTLEERVYVGYIPGIVHVPFASGTAQVRNPRFLRELEAKVPKDKAVLFICRSANRSDVAAAAAAKAGWGSAHNVLEGFEGDLDEQQHRGTLGGWRLRGLPWIQD